MEIAIAAFLFTKGNVNINHKKSPEKIQSSNLFKLN
ncbi:hypothetical protein J2W57_002745 [Chryseobacterium ginsenosidimutans]|jgi:hypothetical protein|uniref:Uncharacterized protein n=1 Tax=Chryseobacterium geocarposphaerae TaxID=1416776 RepID=A0ABU1LHG2_9FLAO|nr:hypothetical protein [Chryseobacterium geocarposphaerae]MDR6699355.1 hypothetical protein [Chryseobacterium ginsenosidimutans]